MTPNSSTQTSAANSESSRSRTFRAVGLPLAVAIFTVVVSTLAWYYTTQYFERLSQQELYRNLSSLSRTIDESRSARLQALNRLRRRMESINDYQAPSFKLDANFYLNNFPSFRSMAWLDKDLAVIELLNQPAVAITSCDRYVTCQALLQSVSRNGVDKTANPQLLADGVLVQWIALSVKPPNEEASFLLVQLDYSVMLQRTMRNALPDSPLRVSFAGKPLYTRNVPIDLPAARLDHSVGTVALRLDAWKTAGASTINFPNILLILGLIVGGLLAMALRLAALANQRAKIAQLVEHNLRLTMLQREHSQQALDTTEKEIGTLVEGMAEGFVMLDAQWNFVYLNHRAEVILRRSREELIGKYCWAEFPEVVDNPMYRAYQKAVQSGEPVSLETYYSPLECWLEIRAHPHPKGLAVYFQDISARKKNAEKFLHTENILHTAGHTAHFGGWSLDVANDQMLWSDEVCSIHGMPTGSSPSLEEAINFYSTDSRGLFKQLISKCVSEAVAFDEELQIINAMGDLLWVRAIGQPVIDNNGQVVKLNGAFQKIHERKRSNQECAKESLFLQTMLENLLEGIVACDAQGKLTLFNRATREFHGLPELALTPEHWSQYYNLYLPDGVTPMSMEQIPLFRALRGEMVRDVEMVIKPTNQPARLVLCNGEKIKTDDGVLLGAVVVMFDITNRRHNELSLSRSRRALNMLTACNEAIIRAKDESGLLEAVCKIIVDIGGYRLVWVGYKRDDVTQTIEIAARAGTGLDYLSDLKLSWSEAAIAGQGPAGRTVRSNAATVIEDVTQEPSFAPWLVAAMQRDLRGVICLPLRQNNEVFGILNLYAGEVRPVESEEVQLLQNFADDLAFGVVTLRSRAQQHRLESALITVASGVSASVGNSFFLQLTHSITDALGAQAAFVSEFLPEQPFKARTVSAVVDGQTIENFDYVVKGTPCENFTSQQECIVLQDVVELFPSAPTLAALGAQAYVGRRLEDSNGRPMGSLFVLFREPLLQSDTVISTLRIFASRAAAEMERQHSDNRLHDQASLLDQAQDAIIVQSIDGRVTYWNKGAERLYGWSEHAALGQSIKALLQADEKHFFAIENAVVNDGEWNGEITGWHQDGRPFVVEARWTLLKDEVGHPRSMLTIMTDITERKNNELIDAEQRNILSGIASRQPLERTLEAVVRLYERQCPGALCSILLLADDRTLLHGSAPSLPDAFNDAVQGEKIGEGAGSCGTALWRGERVVVSDIANDPLWKNYADLALAHGLRACWSTPVKAPDGKAIASFAVYYREIREPTEMELQAIDDIAALAAIAIEQSNSYRKLALSEQRFRSLFYEHPDAVCAMDLDGRFVDYNGGFSKSTGTSPLDVIGHMFDELIAPENRLMVRNYFNAAAQGEAQTYESAGIAANGERFDFRMTNLPILVEGKITGVFGIAHDITALRKHERDLADALGRAQENSRQLRRLSQVAMVINQQLGQNTHLDQELVDLLRDTMGVHQAALSLVQGDGLALDIDVVSLSDKYSQWRTRSMAFDHREVAELLNPVNGSVRLTQDELAKHPRWSLPDSASAVRPPMRGLLAVPLIGRDGSNIGLLQLTDKLEGDFTEDDELIAVQFAGMASTAIERNRLIERLRERDKFFEMSLEIFVMFNPATQKWVQVNPVFAQLTGFSQEELCAVEFLTFLHPADRPAAEERSRLLQAGQGVANSFINRYVCSDGSLRWIEWVSVPSPDGLVYGVGRDISERRKSEIALQQTLVDLNNRNRELQDFAFVASHDLQEPLRKIRAFSDRLTTRYSYTLEAQARDYLDRMNQAATRMQVLIDDLLAYSRVATRGKPFTQVNLATICAEVIADLEARIETTQARISYTSLPSITGDATQMRQLFQNLLANALKFHSPERRPEIIITCAAVTVDKEPGFCLEFSDNGIGFEHKYAERIFTPFQRLHSRSDYEGTGIGLAIVRRIVERHHGSIEAFSEPNIGSRFVLCIPQAQPIELPTPITPNSLII